MRHIDGWRNEEDLFCPGCGMKGTVWVGPDDGYFYRGPVHVCFICEACFTMSDYYTKESNNYHCEQLVESLKQALKTKSPG